ncbi:hypothetical protein G9C85_02645 [Halorubellus sp. JP-L1]|uniref:hypothetical protein n=1 Tax=Halorubellus sp. JP-L1 TaxID=2715753 RepID=UPI0014072576|nr:hypothetical protein [Halorubellus sp. JP-L1]NHN40537.1 hypothetical protein [Halorubellus sp. JP-L1]
MTEFGTKAVLDLEVSDASIRNARAEIEDELGGVSVDVDTSTSGQLASSANGRASKERAMSRQLLSDQADSAESIAADSDDLVELAHDRNELLEELVETAAGGGAGSSLRPRSGSGGGGGLLGGGMLLGAAAIVGALTSFSWPDLPSLEMPDAPKIRIPDGSAFPDLDVVDNPPKLDVTPDLPALGIEEPDWLPITVNLPSGDGSGSGATKLAAAGAAGGGLALLAKALGGSASSGLGASASATAGTGSLLSVLGIAAPAVAGSQMQAPWKAGDEKTPRNSVLGQGTMTFGIKPPNLVEMFGGNGDSNGTQQRVNPTGQAQERAQANIPSFLTSGYSRGTVDTIREARQSNSDVYRDDIRRRRTGAFGGNRARESRESGNTTIDVTNKITIDAQSLSKLERELKREMEQVRRDLERIKNSRRV